MAEPDLLTDLRGLLGQHGIADTIISRIVRELRQRYGGDRVFIQKLDRPARNQAIHDDLQQGLPITRIAQRQRCNPATVRRVVEQQRWTL
jgi:DNA-binding NarL/FixJ family response regulator